MIPACDRNVWAVRRARPTTPSSWCTTRRSTARGRPSSGARSTTPSTNSRSSRLLRRIVDGEVGPEEAVHVYHGVLTELKITPYRSLADDLKLTETAIGYGGTKPPCPHQPARPGAARIPTRHRAPSQTRSGRGRASAPDFGKMTSAERLAYHRRRLRVLGS
jgi:hypothetical protein